MLAASAFIVILASLVIGGRETNDIALTRQRETISQALTQHGLALARELRVQTVWTEAFEKIKARDQEWMHAFYGIFLSKLFGYDEIYCSQVMRHRFTRSSAGKMSPPRNTGRSAQRSRILSLLSASLGAHLVTTSSTPTLRLVTAKSCTTSPSRTFATSSTILQRSW